MACETLLRYSDRPDYKYSEQVINSVCFPRFIKAARVKPLNHNVIDSDIQKYYRPVTNLTFVTEVIEMAVAFHLSICLINNNLNE